MADGNKLIKHTSSYEQCMMLRVNSWKMRANIGQLLESLEAYDQIKLSTFASKNLIA